MKKILIALILLVSTLGLTAGTAVAAKPQPVTPTIAIDPSSQLWLGGTLKVDATYPKLNVPVDFEVLCYQPTDPSGYAQYVDGKGFLVYGEMRAIAGSKFENTDTLVLGGGMSAWYLNDGPAHCEAILFYYTFNPVEVYHYLAGPAVFDAAGRP